MPVVVLRHGEIRLPFRGHARTAPAEPGLATGIAQPDEKIRTVTLPDHHVPEGGISSVASFLSRPEGDGVKSPRGETGWWDGNVIAVGAEIHRSTAEFEAIGRCDDPAVSW